jgi:nitroreductase/NAD-dependent dihydropyrimidine dehydrogenase PreA subunit
MPIVNSRTREGGQAVIDRERCTRCGTCVEICPSTVLELRDGAVVVDHSKGFDCIGCGQCMAVCPVDAIAVTGRTLSPADMFPLDPVGQAAPEQFAALLASRRSVRHYKKEPVSRADLDRVLELAALAPMGIPPWDVGVTVLDTPEKVRGLAQDTIQAARYSKPVLKAMASPLLRPVLMRGTPPEMLSDFLLPLLDTLVSEWDAGRDVLLYDAPAALLFHHSPFSDPADAYIAATYAMLATHSLGLGTVMIGTVPPFMARDKKMLAKYGVPPGHKPAALLCLGHPRVKFRKGVHRTFQQVKYI